MGFKFVKLAREVGTHNTWDAWFHGTDDNPPIQWLEDQYDVAWRNHRVLMFTVPPDDGIIVTSFPLCSQSVTRSGVGERN